jgi:uncharacterized protein (TIGR03435 family)
MKRLVLLGIAIFVASGLMLRAQDVAGTWQGTIEDGKDELRSAVRIVSDDGKLSGTFYSIDQGGDPFALSSISRQGDTLTFAIALINGSFSGRFSDDGNSVSGVWSQNRNKLPLRLVRASGDAAWDIPKPVSQMAKDADPAFEVATIKPTKPGPDNEEDDFGVDGRKVSTEGTSLVDLIDFAYDMHRKQIAGAPDWARSDLYDIAGVADQPGEPSYDQSKSMMRKLLMDRFQLKFHLEKRELPVYLLTVGKNGLKNVTRSADQSATFNIDIEPVRGGVRMAVNNGTMANFAIFGLQADVVDRPVQDRSGRTEHDDFALTWMPDESQFRGQLHLKTSKHPQAGLFTGIEEQLGMKLEPAKAPVDVMVIDHVEKPSAN